MIVIKQIGDNLRAKEKIQVKPLKYYNVLAS